LLDGYKRIAAGHCRQRVVVAGLVQGVGVPTDDVGGVGVATDEVGGVGVGKPVGMLVDTGVLPEARVPVPVVGTGVVARTVVAVERGDVVVAVGVMVSERVADVAGIGERVADALVPAWDVAVASGGRVDVAASRAPAASVAVGKVTGLVVPPSGASCTPTRGVTKNAVGAGPNVAAACWPVSNV
jgi:hypothetical protein